MISYWLIIDCRKPYLQLSGSDFEWSLRNEKTILNEVAAFAIKSQQTQLYDNFDGVFDSVHLQIWTSLHDVL